jgi:hypothetical protein
MMIQRRKFGTSNPKTSQDGIYHEMAFYFDIWWSLIQNIRVKNSPNMHKVLCITPRKKNEKTLNNGEGP